MAKQGQPFLPMDENIYKSAGVDPKTFAAIRGLENAYEDGIPLLEGTYNLLKLIDEQDAVKRYTWYNLPSGINGELLERILYYRWKGMFFQMKSTGKFFFLPFALDGSIDVYGRYTGVTPLPFNGSVDSESNKEKAWIQGLTFEPVRGLEEAIEALQSGDVSDYCVILTDYTKSISEESTPRANLQEPVLRAMAEIFPLAQTNLVLNCGIRGLKVESQEQADEVFAMNKVIKKAALTCKQFLPMTGKLDLQELGSNHGVLKSEEFLVYLQALDNFRLSLYGLKNGGLFQKKAHMLESEEQLNTGTTDLIYNDGLDLRQEFCDLVNIIFDLGIWCEPSESVIGADMNGDGTVSSNQEPIQTQSKVEE